MDVIDRQDARSSSGLSRLCLPLDSSWITRGQIVGDDAAPAADDISSALLLMSSLP